MRRFGLSSFGLIVLILISIQTITVTAPNPIPKWAKTYHATGAVDSAMSMQQTADGGFIVAGSTNSSGVPGTPHAWVLKLDSLGNVVWQKTYGGTGPDSANSVRQTTDGGFILAGGLTNSSSGIQQGWVFKLDSMGGMVWQKTYFGGLPLDTIWQSSDSGFIVAGTGQISCFGCFAGMFGEWVVKLDPLGNISWQKVFSLGISNHASSVRQTSDGGFIVAGRVKGCCSPGNADNWDALIFKLNATGGLVWQKTYGGPDYDEARSIQLTSDGGFIVAGAASGWGAHGPCSPFPCTHDWVFKLDSVGNVIWQKAYGGSAIENAFSVGLTSDGGYIVVGTTSSPGGAWIFKLDAVGNILWEDGGSSSAISSVQQTSDGGYIAVGTSSGASVVKLDANGNISPGCPVVGLSNSTATNTNATVTTPPIRIGNTLATVAASSATVADTAALTSVQCAANEPPDFTISANPSNLIVKQGSFNTTTITINSTNGFTGTITLNASIVPVGKLSPSVTLTLRSATIAPSSPATVLVTVTTKGGTAVGTYTVKVTGSSGGLSTTITIPVQVVKKK